MTNPIYYKRFTGSTIQGNAENVTEPIGTLVVTNGGDLRYHDGSIQGGVAVGGGIPAAGGDYNLNSDATLSIIATGTAGQITIGTSAGAGVVFHDTVKIYGNETYYSEMRANGHFAIPGTLETVTGTTGDVTINSNDGTTTSTWTFGQNGLLTTPDGMEMGAIEGTDTFGFYRNSATDFILELGGGSVWVCEGATGHFVLPTDGAIKPSNTSDAHQILKIYPTQQDGNHLHLSTGDLSVTSLFLGTDAQYVRTRADGAIVIGTGDSVPDTTGLGHRWVFDSTGALTFPDATVQTTAYDGSSVSALNGYFLNLGDPLNLHTDLRVVTRDDSGNAYYAGGTEGNSPGYSPIIIKVDPNGEVLWQTTIVLPGTVNSAYIFSGYMYVTLQGDDGKAWFVNVDPTTGDISYDTYIDMTGSNAVITARDCVFGPPVSGPPYVFYAGTLEDTNTNLKSGLIYGWLNSSLGASVIAHNNGGNLDYYGIDTNPATGDAWCVGQSSNYGAVVSYFTFSGLQWTKSINFAFTSSLALRATSVAYHDGYIYVVSSEVPAPYANNGFLTKLNATTGAVVWQKAMGYEASGNSDETSMWFGCVTIDGNGDIVTAWNYSAVGSQNQDIYVAKFDTSGTRLWQRTVETSLNDYTDISQATEFLTADSTYFYLAITAKENTDTGAVSQGAGIKLPLDGTGIGSYGIWTYREEFWGVYDQNVTGGTVDVSSHFDLTSGPFTVSTTQNTSTSQTTISTSVDLVYTGAGSGNQLRNGTRTFKLNDKGSITFPDGSEQAGASGQLPNWLKVVHHTQHLPYYGIDFGWDTNGLWTTNATVGNSNENVEGTSYPFRTNFTIPQDHKTIVTVDFDNAGDSQTDFGMAFFQDGVNPVWSWMNISGGGNRIGAQYNNSAPELYGLSGGHASNGSIGSGTYRARFTIDPTGGAHNVVTLDTFDSSGYLLMTMTYNDDLFTGPYRVGFASDNDNGTPKGYFRNLTIDVNNGDDVYYDTLQGDNNLTLGILKNTGWNFSYDLTAPTLRLSGPNGPDQIIITGPEPTPASPSAQRLIIQGQRGYGRWGDSTSGEGGDVYIWGGVGGENNTNGNGSGGDIKLRGGQSFNAEGGYIKIEAGYADNTTSGGGNTNYGAGGYVQINAANANGLGNGGYIQLKAGIAQGSGTNGSITLQTSNSHTWTYGNDGNLILPSGGTIKNSSGTDLFASSGASVGDFVIVNTTLSAAAGSVAISSYGISGLAWNTGDNTYVVTYPSAIGYGYHTKVKFASTGVSQLDNYTFYLNPYNNSTTQYGIYSDYDCTIKVNGSAFDSWTSGGVTTELITGSKITIKTGAPSNDTDPGAIEFKIGGKTYGWTIDKDNHLRLPADGGNSKIKNYYGHNALFAEESITIPSVTRPSGVPTGVTSIHGSSVFWQQEHDRTNLPTTGGTGTGLVVDVTENAGTVDSVTIVRPGYGYTDGDLITVTSNAESATFFISVDASTATWAFNTDGNLAVSRGVKFPNNTVQTSAYSTNYTGWFQDAGRAVQLDNVRARITSAGIMQVTTTVVETEGDGAAFAWNGIRNKGTTMSAFGQGGTNWVLPGFWLDISSTPLDNDFEVCTVTLLKLGGTGNVYRITYIGATNSKWSVVIERVAVNGA